MKTLRVVIFAILCIFVLSVGKIAAFNNESLQYKVMYKWGLVNKQAGTATLSLKRAGDNYNMLLTAASDPWADKVYKVRDTLVGVMDVANLNPLLYKKMSHEGSERKHDEVHYTINGNSVTGKCIRKKWGKNGKISVNQQQILTAEGKTLDMLSAFYYMRSLSYASMKPGTVKKVNLFSGKRKETLTITYKGVETIELDGKTYKTYHITFRFFDPTKAKKQTDAPMDAWLSADARCIPLMLEGKLKIGKVQCFYTGG